MKSATAACLFLVCAISFATAEIAETGSIFPQNIVNAVNDFFTTKVDETENIGEELEEILENTESYINLSNETDSNSTINHHDLINMELADDEERVHARGGVEVRKKRFICKRCLPTVSYGYGGGGGCCGSCGNCGGGRYVRPVRIRVAVPVVSYGGYGGYGGGCGRCGCGGCGGGYNPCGVCGR